MHIISSFSKSHYILFTEIHICSSQINTINPSPQINTICFFRRYTQCIIFSDRHTISYFKIYKLYFLYRSTHMFSEKHTIFSSHHILFTELFTIPSSQKNTLYRPYHYINIFSDTQLSDIQVCIFSSQK